MSPVQCYWAYQLQFRQVPCPGVVRQHEMNSVLVFFLVDILFNFALFWLLFVVWTFGFHFCLCSGFVCVHLLLVFLLFVCLVGLVCLLETGFLCVSPAGNCHADQVALISKRSTCL